MKGYDYPQAGTILSLSAVIADNKGASRSVPTNQPAPTLRQKSLRSLIGALKTISTKKINIIRNTPGTPAWQRNYYEHIIRDEESLNKIRQYIINNPLFWQIDRLHPNILSKW